MTMFVIIAKMKYIAVIDVENIIGMKMVGVETLVAIVVKNVMKLKKDMVSIANTFIHTATNPIRSSGTMMVLQMIYPMEKLVIMV